MSERILFLDRDGTLNRTFDGRPPNAPDEVELLPGVGPALAHYARDGWHLVIVTNQSGVARGYFTEGEAHAVLRRVIDLLPVPVDAAYLCPHVAGAPLPAYDLDCPNRKPRPGFLLQALDRFHARPEDALFVGDAITDRQAAEAAGVPFRWADRFFGRPLDRGMQTRAGQWFQVREVTPEAGERRRLVASLRGVEIGWLALQEGDEARVEVTVEAEYRGQGIEETLLGVSRE